MVKRHDRFVMLSFLLLFVLLSSCQETQHTKQQDEKVILHIAAASSLTEALTEIGDVFQQLHPSTRIQFQFGGSGKLATQILHGAPADLFLSASEKEMQTLKKEGLLEKEGVPFTTNSLVFITNVQSSIQQLTFDQLLSKKIETIAVGEPTTVPAGMYAKQVFNQLNGWEAYQSKFVIASNVRQVLTYVEMQNTDIGIVYETDAKMSDQVRVVAKVPSDWHDAIIYPAAILKNANEPALAEQFLEFVMSEQGQNILQSYGFQPIR